MTTEINANDTGLAQNLADIGNLGQGTLVSLIVQKKGVERGPAGDRKVYGDDKVHVLMWTGFHYKALVERSAAKLERMWASGNFLSETLGKVISSGCAWATIEDVSAAAQELQGNFHRVLHDRDPMAGAGVDPVTIPPSEIVDPNEHILGGPPLDPAKIVSKPVFETLKVGDETILGAKVYIGKGNPDDPRAAEPGTIYIDGVKLGELVIEPAVNGPWKAKKSTKTVAKEIIRAQLPVGLYVRYSLKRDKLDTVKIGADASAHAKAANVPVEPENIRNLFKIAV